MQSSSSRFYTYFQDALSPVQRQRVQEHMDDIGFGSTANPAVFAAEDYYFLVSAMKDTLSRTSQLPMHSHTFMEIFQYVSDSQVEYLIGTHRYCLQQGDFVCIPPGICHQVLHYEPEGTPCVRNLIAIGPAFLDSIGWARKNDQVYLLRLEDEQKHYLSELFEICVQESQRRELRWTDMLAGYAHILLAQMDRNAGNSIKAEKDGFFEKILAYIDGNLQNKISLQGAADFFFVSARTITREFQKELGTSFYRYVTQRRLLTARSLIFQDLSLEEVCRCVGFSDYPTFYRAFKKEYGISPRQMKNLDRA